MPDRVNSSRWIKLFSSVFLFLFVGAVASRAGVTLVSLQPQSVMSRDPRRDVNPQPLTFLRLRGRESRSAVRFSANSEVTYAIPVGQNSFTGVIAYAEANNAKSKGDSDVSNCLQVIILIDGKSVLDLSMDDLTPPRAFSIPVTNAHQLKVVSDQEYSWEDFALADAAFSDHHTSANSTLLPARGEGYVDLMPLPRQGLFRVYRPGESVPLKAYFNGSAQNSEVSIRIKSEQPAPPIPDTTLRLTLRPAGSGSEGTATWRVPNQRGPAILEVDQRINHVSIFHRRVRIAIAPQIDLARISNSAFGIHTSSPGFLGLADKFASLWGAKWDRVFLRWEIVESTPGKYDFSRADSIVDSLLAQNIRILGVLGENTPDWARGPLLDTAWKNFVQQAIRHYRGKIDHWDVFNEPDVKYADSPAEAGPDFDLRLIHSAVATIHAADPRAIAVCCSTGTTPWLLYDKRLFDTGLLRSLDVVSLHPYQLVAPEEKDGAFNYEERLVALDSLMKSYGSPKPIWATEANWILGTRGEPDVNAPDIDEHTQAEYVVRVNLLSLAHSVPYFLHMPFSHSHHKQIHLDTLAAYANLASLLSEATNPRRLSTDPYAYAFTWDTPTGTVTAAWTVYGTAVVNLSGFQTLRALDFYGNPGSSDISSLTISPAPTFIVARNAASPHLTVSRPPAGPAWHNVTSVERWPRAKQSAITSISEGIEVTSGSSKYAQQIHSPDIPIQPNSCHLARIKVGLKAGAVMAFAQDKVTGKRVGDPVYVAHVPDGTAYQVQWRFISGSVTNIQLVLADGNLQPAVSRFDVLNPAQIAVCP
jgi:hypothetical protein